MIHCNSGGRFTEGSHFKHCKPYVFSAYSNQKFLCEWLCIITDQISGFLYQKYDWKFILQFLLLTCNLFCCTLTCLTVYKLLWLCIITDQISGFLYQKYDWKFILQFLLLTCNLFCCTLTCLTVYKLLSLFLVCSLRIYINEMVLGCVDMQLQVNRQILLAASHSGTVDVLLFTQFGVHRDFRCTKF